MKLCGYVSFTCTQQNQIIQRNPTVVTLATVSLHCIIFLSKLDYIQESLLTDFN